MPDYKNMYRNLFKSVTEAIGILQQAQIEAEEMYIDSAEVDEKKFSSFRIVESKQHDDEV